MRYQTGLSKWGWLITVVLLIGAFTTLIRLVPHYIDFNIVQGVLERLPEESVHADMTRSEIRDYFRKQFRVENFRIPVTDMLTITRDKSKTVLDVDYEIREPLLYNIDVVLTFREQRVYE